MIYSSLFLLVSAAYALANPSLVKVAENLKDELRQIENFAAGDGVSGVRTNGVVLQQQVSAECIATAQRARDAATAAQTACGDLPQTLLNTFQNFDTETPIDNLNGFCTDFNRDCAPAVNSLLAEAVRTLDDCSAFLTTAPNPLQPNVTPGRVIGNAIAIQMLAQMLCLQVDNQLCLVTVYNAIRATNSSTFTQCADVFQQSRAGLMPGQPDSEPFCGEEGSGCMELVQGLFDEAGCCFTGYLAILQASVALVIPEVNTFTFPATFCGGDLVFCPEVADYATNVLGAEKFVLEDPSPSSNPNGPNSAAHAAVSLVTLVGGVMASFGAQL